EHPGEVPQAGIGDRSADEVLEDGDLLVFVGDVNDVIDLRSRPGLQPAEDEESTLAQATALAR
ncbi:MAG: hypothetical protein AAFO29_16910, partial [Actinomycetota bacterium]